MPQLSSYASSSRQPVFPLEIFDLIVTSLVQSPDTLYPWPCSSDLWSTLRACALVCRSFLHLCRPHLFREVEIGPSYPSARRRLAELIDQNPQLSKYIRRLSYCRTTPFRLPGDPEIAHLLPILRLPNVNMLSIRTVQDDHSTRIHYYEDEGFRNFFDNIIASGKLATLHLHGVLGAPIFQIVTAPRLETLTVDTVMFTQWGPFFTHTSTLKIHMKRFSLHETEFDLAALSCFTDLEEVSFGYGWPSYHSFGSNQDNALFFPKLRSLSVCNEFNPVMTICQTAQRAGLTAFPNVNNLIISLETHKGNISDVTQTTPCILWYHLPSLESVNIQLSVSRQSVKAYCLLRLDHCLRMCKRSLKQLCITAQLSGPDDVRAVVHPLHYFLEFARGDNAVEDIDIKLHIKPVTGGDELGSSWDYKAVCYHVIMLKHFLTLLSDRSESGFPGLRKVGIRFCIERTESGGDSLDEYRRYLVDGLTRMVNEDGFAFFDWKVLFRRMDF